MTINCNTELHSQELSTKELQTITGGYEGRGTGGWGGNYEGRGTGGWGGNITNMPRPKDHTNFF